MRIVTRALATRETYLPKVMMNMTSISRKSDIPCIISRHYDSLPGEAIRVCSPSIDGPIFGFRQRTLSPQSVSYT